MEERIHYAKAAPLAYHAMLGLEKYLRECGIEEGLLHLMKLRASQINGCAYCLDMHWKDLKAIGETEQRMYSLDAWRECPYYSDRERAALAWTDAVTRVAETHVPDEVYQEVKKQFSEKELADLTVAVATINAWNRLAIAGAHDAGNLSAAGGDQEERLSGCQLSAVSLQITVVSRELPSIPHSPWKIWQWYDSRNPHVGSARA